MISRFCKYTALFAVVLFLGKATPAFSDPITVTVDPPIALAPQSGEFDFGFDGLNGLVLSGQSLSADFVFADDELARLRVNDYGFMLLDIETNANAFPGFAGDGPTGFLLSADRSPLGGLIDAGVAAGSNGSFSVGIDLPVLAPVINIAGTHFDLTLPSTGFVVTGAKLRLGVNDPSTVQFGTRAQLPENVPPGVLGAVWALFVVCGRRFSPLRHARR